MLGEKPERVKTLFTDAVPQAHALRWRRLASHAILHGEAFQ